MEQRGTGSGPTSRPKGPVWRPLIPYSCIHFAFWLNCLSLHLYISQHTEEEKMTWFPKRAVSLLDREFLAVRPRSSLRYIIFLILPYFFCCCSVAQSCLTLCNSMDCSTPGFPVLHHLLELAQTHVDWVSDAIQPSRPLSSPSPPAFSLSQHQALFQWVSSSHQVAKVLELQLQHQSFQWIFRTDFL